MNAILMVLSFTAIVILDYVWMQFEGKLKDKRSAAIFKAVIVGTLLVAGWWQAILQYRRESKSDKDMAYLKQQLAHANESLTNSTAVVKGLTTGGDYLPDVSSSLCDETNALRFTLWSEGEYPLRDLFVKITDETLRINQRKPDTALPPGKTVFERFLGNFPAKGVAELCNVKLDPAITNYVRIDLQALNGSYWEIFDIFKTNESWALKVHYRWKQIAGQKVQIDPPEMRGFSWCTKLA